MMTCRGLHVIRDLYSVCPIMASNTEFLEERGIHVPEDLSVVSFDDAELQDTTDIKLLSAIHPKNKLGRITGNHLLRMMDDENWQTKNYAYRFPAKLNDGNSVRKL